MLPKAKVLTKRPKEYLYIYTLCMKNLKLKYEIKGFAHMVKAILVLIVLIRHVILLLQVVFGH